MSPRNWQFRLEDIYESLLKIEEYTEGLDYTRWQHDRKTVDAVVRNLEIYHGRGRGINTQACHAGAEYAGLYDAARRV